MKLNKTTVGILKNFSTINGNLLIKAGSKISTVSPSKDIFAEFEGDDKFDKQVSIFNLPELLGVFGLFTNPDITLEDKYLEVQEGKSKVKYIYADESVLIVPTKSITFPTADITLKLTADNLENIKKTASILGVSDMSIIGDGKTITLQISDVKNKSSNNFNVEIGETTEKFNVHIKIDRLIKLIEGNYEVNISNKGIAQFNHDKLKLVVYIALESDSEYK